MSNGQQKHVEIGISDPQQPRTPDNALGVDDIGLGEDIKPDDARKPEDIQPDPTKDTH